MGKLKIQLRRGRIVTALIALGLLISGLYCTVYIKIPVVSQIPSDYMKLMKGGKRIAVVARSARQLDLNQYSNWTGVLQGTLESTLSKYGYFTLVDLAGRKDRLREIALSRSGLTADEKEIGQELAIDGFLYIDVPKQPLYDCKQHEKWTQKTKCTRKEKITTPPTDSEREHARKSGTVAQPKTKTICVQKTTTVHRTVFYITYMTVFLDGRLVNTETGQSISYTHAEPSTITGSSCTAHSSMFQDAADKAAGKVAEHLSPRITPLEAPVLDDMVGVPDAAADKVKAYLKKGIEWADATPPNYEKAKGEWEQALESSGLSSASAFWNLAIYYWYSGDVARAEEYFSKAERIGTFKFIKGKKMNIFSKFLHEKYRKSIEASAEE